MYQPSKELPATVAVPEVHPNHELAEAMRRGSKTTRPCIRSTFQYGRLGLGVVAACAIGAAYVGGYDITQIPRSLSCEIIALNDEHGWTREKIADWLETL